MNRRQQCRYPLDVIVRARKVDAASPSRVYRLADASTAGVALVGDRQPGQPGESVELEILTSDGRLVEPRLKTRVVYAEPDAKGTYRAGCAFLHAV